MEEEIIFEKDGDDEVKANPNKSGSFKRKEVSFDDQIATFEHMERHEDDDDEDASYYDNDIESGHKEMGFSGNRQEEDVPRRRFLSKVNEDANDTETEKKGGVRFQHAMVRSDTEGIPQSHTARSKRHFMNFFTHKKSRKNKDAPREMGSERSEELKHISSHGRFVVSSRTPGRTHPSQANDSDTSDSSIRPRQYRLEAIRPNSRRSDWRLLKKLGIPMAHLTIYESLDGQRSACSVFGINPNQLVVKYLHWTFRSSFLAVILSAVIVYFAWTFGFAVPIYYLAKRHPTCIGGVGTAFEGLEGGTFIDSYTLSWTTFNTVGYGVIHSGISTTEPDKWKCAGMTVLTTTEAFIGLLFSSMSGAILFAKVARVQSFAQVIFSDPIVIRYGSGVNVEKDEDEMEEIISEETEDLERIPPPVLEFRINNRLHSTAGGEIIDATVNIVASIDASQACPTVKNAMRRKGGGKKKKIRRLKRTSRKSAPYSTDSETSSHKPHIEPLSLAEFIRSVSLKTTTHQTIDEDPTGHLVPRRIFTKLEVETPDHPFFKRTWILRHILNEHSPLLKPHARQLMRLNKGFWPKQLNTQQQVRDAIHFDQILVSMSGTSNADVVTVYAQHAYHFSDLYVGYRFANQIFRDPADNTLRVDTRLINDVKEQVGGGGETLSSRANDVNRTQDILVL